MEELLHLIITGASGFLGSELVAQARGICPAAHITPLYSPREGGIDLTDSNLCARLSKEVPLGKPSSTALIHAAAVIDAPAGGVANTTMATQLAKWAQSAGIGFCVLVSSVSVYTPLLGNTPVNAVTRPVSPYGRDKLNAEGVWQRTLPPEKIAIVRLAGVWGWQRRPTLFWNRLLLAAAQGSPPEPVPVVQRKRSYRNYISAREAAECLIHLAMNRKAGTFLAAGMGPTNTETFVQALQRLPGSRLAVECKDDGERDECLYSCSPDIAQWLEPFESTLAAIWAAKPDWVLE